MRLFLALNLPPDLRRAVWTAASPFRDTLGDANWVRDDKIHLTLKFFGEVDSSAAPAMIEAVDRLAAGHAAPVVRISGAGGFPNLKRPRVLWLGVDPEARLELLHHDVELAFDKLGFELEGKAFRPHLTVGRVRSRIDAETAKALRAAAGRIRFSDEFLAESIDLMQSVPGATTYTVLHAAPMRVR
jgi:2'-5' RNA ligase